MRTEFNLLLTKLFLGILERRCARNLDGFVTYHTRSLLPSSTLNLHLREFLPEPAFFSSPWAVVDFPFASQDFHGRCASRKGSTSRSPQSAIRCYVALWPPSLAFSNRNNWEKRWETARGMIQQRAPLASWPAGTGLVSLSHCPNNWFS